VPRRLLSSLQANPIVAAVNDMNKLPQALTSPCDVVFLLKGNIFNLKDTVDKVHGAGKIIYVHFDLIDGFSSDQVALKYVKEIIHPDGVITTRSNLIKYARDLNLGVIQRLFMIDSLSVETGIRSVTSSRPDAIELLPGIIPRIVKRVTRETKIPIISGGLIESKDDVIANLKAGAVGISTSRQDLWEL